MKKLFSLIKISLSHDMNIFKINSKKQSKFSKVMLPIILTLYIMALMGMYSGMLMEQLKPLHLGYVVLTLFVLFISILTIVEGIYKSGNLLFNCKDDDLLLSLPIKKNTVLFIRIFKFYAFEFLYNTLFLAPAMFIYAVNILPGWTFYLSSIVALFVLPIIPIVISCIIGFIITYTASKFKGKNIFQTIFTTLFLLIIMYLSFNMESFITNIAEKASSINDFIVRLYYPAGAYIKLVTNFQFKDLIIFILIHIIIFALIIYILGLLYFKINSSSKGVLTGHKNKKYIIKSSSQTRAIIKKELKKFLLTPVYITNAGFGLVLFVIACVVISIKFDSIILGIVQNNSLLSIDTIKNQLPVYMFGLVCFASLMTSITSSMISLEGKSINILKSLPINSYKIVLAKLLTAVLIMIPCILIGDIIIFIRFKFDFISIVLIVIATFLLSFVSELIGIIINLKYPKLDATNDTEVVKQSMSSMVATFIGMGLLGITVILLFKILDTSISNDLIILIFIFIYLIIGIILNAYLYKNCDKYFNNINV